ncbi:MAG: selenium cofactor biosynthesis protein YqeC [Gammaproteobacteria bacterium]|jgi:probable selenium-dependent hydroxylase accessory protein YqeC
MTISLPEALVAQSGFICLVGAGGKKSTMYALAAAHPGRVLLSSTSHMYPYDADRVDQIVTLGDPQAPMPATGDARVVAVAADIGTPKRVGGIDAQRLREIFREGEFDVCVIKADGARARWIKAPGEYEPVIPDFATTVIPVVSVKVVGRPLDERIAHRPERLTALLGIAPGATIEAEHVSALLASPRGALQGVGDAQVIPLINMVDDDRLRAIARGIARAALAQSERISAIVLACMKQARIVEIVTRDAAPAAGGP